MRIGVPQRYRNGRSAGLAGPFSVGAYILWAAVGFHPLLEVVHGRLSWNSMTVIGVTALLAVPALFALTVSKIRQPVGSARLWAQTLIILEAAAALAVCWGLGGTTLDSSAMAALLVVPAAQAPTVYRAGAGFLLLLAFDMALLLLLATRLDWGVAGSVVLAYGAFQLFAALAVAYSRRADQARDAALRINAELLATRQLLLEGARGEERLRLSRDLHDIVGHKLTALKLQLRLCARDAALPTRQFLDECMRLADDLLTDVRGVVGALRASDGVDLHESLAALVPAVTHPRIRLELAPDARVPGVAQAQTLLRCAQEGLTNALRHSGAENIVIRLERSAGGVTLSIEDDGPTRTPPSWGNGLRGMEERLTIFGGTLAVAGATPGGLMVRAWLPQAEPPEPSA